MQLLNQPLWAFYSTTLRKIRTFGVITSINSFCCSITVIVTLLKTFFSHRQYTITIPRGKKLISLLPTGLGKTKRMCITHVHSCTFIHKTLRTPTFWAENSSKLDLCGFPRECALSGGKRLMDCVIVSFQGTFMVHMYIRHISVAVSAEKPGESD